MYIILSQDLLTGMELYIRLVTTVQGIDNDFTPFLAFLVHAIVHLKTIRGFGELHVINIYIPWCFYKLMVVHLFH